MKNVLQKILPIGLILVVIGVTYFLYEQGEITLFTKKEKTMTEQSLSTQIPISEKEFKISYKDSADATFDIANFEEEENWFGDGVFDYAVLMEGKSSLFLTSLNGQKSTVSLKKNFNIQDVLNFKFLFNVATEPEEIEEFNLIFNSGTVSYFFPIRDTHRGWNLLVLSKEKFSVKGKESEEIEGKEEISEVIVELVSRPKARSTVNLDSLWAEKEGSYADDWDANSDKFLSLKKFNDETKLLAIGFVDNKATIKKGSASDFTIQGEFIPLTNGRFGLFLRGDRQSGFGYYFLMGGPETDSWQILKFGLFEEKQQWVDLKKGTITNFKMDKEKPYWLKVEAKGQKLTFYLSLNGKDFTKLEEVNDESFSSGGLGFVALDGNIVLVDNIQFSQ